MRRVVMVVCAALLIVWLSIKSRSGQNLFARPAFRVLSGSRISVKVSGDVRHSGIYEVPANTMAASVINMAKPLRALSEYDKGTSSAVPLLNGNAVKLSIRSDATRQITVDRMTVPECMVLGIPLDIATMSEADFERLPGIGPTLAKRIVTYRQSNGGILRVKDLAAIEGIGEKKLELILKAVQPAVINK
jgi:competence protein ComEA